MQLIAFVLRKRICEPPPESRVAQKRDPAGNALGSVRCSVESC
jgi:hypothetical protein